MPKLHAATGGKYGAFLFGTYAFALVLAPYGAHRRLRSF